jgi:glycosyltransferase involved in cell wall biosynthesis
MYTDNVTLGGADLSMRHLLAHLDPGIEIAVLGVTPAIVERLASGRSGVSSEIVPTPRSGHDLRTLIGHVQAVRRFAPDVVHANLSSPWSCQYGIAAAGLLRHAHVVAVYHLAVPPISERQRKAKRLTLWAVDRHVGVGERMSREVERVVGLPTGTLGTIHNGIPDQPAKPYGRPRPGPLIGAIGRLEHQKGFDLLIQALPGVEGASLVVVGDGGERAALEKLAHDVGVADRIVWAGWSDDPRGYLGPIDVLAVPSRFEGFPLVILEALLGGTPVVAADVGSVSEAVRDGETGLLVPPGDAAALAGAIDRALNDSELRDRLAADGPRLVRERFLASHMAAAFEELYAQLVR